jgi:formamidopyrimidine-DNA glycosylase
MPELPEVQTVVDTLSPRLLGRTICSTDHVRDDIVRPCGFDLRRALRGRVVTGLSRRGKRIVFALDDGNRFYIHLGMSGRLTVEPENAPVKPHTHLVVALGLQQLRLVDPRRFGGVFWLGQDGQGSAMGPEPLGLRVHELAERLGRTTRAIKNALLDQTLVAGLGNIYVDEALHAAGIHPLTPADKLSLDDVRQLNRSIKVTLRRAIRHRGSTLRDYVDADGEAGGFQLLHRVYGREGEPCRRCKTRIERIVLGGRSTHFCRRCQKAKRGLLRVGHRGRSEI